MTISMFNEPENQPAPVAESEKRRRVTVRKRAIELRDKALSDPEAWRHVLDVLDSIGIPGCKVG